MNEAIVKNNKKQIVWLTGNTGAGKTSIAYLLKERLNAVVLDGDELRASISIDLGFSKNDRDSHNMRVARLAKVLHHQGLNVVVSVIAPFQSTRRKITKLINPFWVYIRGGKIGKDMPYEIPEKPDLVVDPMTESLLESLEKIVKRLSN